MFHQTVYVGNASADKVYVRTTYEKWQQLKFSTEVKLLSGTSTGGSLDFSQASDLTEGYTALAPHHALKMIGSFFSAEVDGPAAPAAAAPPSPGEKRVSISRNYRVPNGHGIIVTPQHTLQVVRSRKRWKARCREFCPFMFKEKVGCWKRQGTSNQDPARQPCQVCGRTTHTHHTNP